MSRVKQVEEMAVTTCSLYRAYLDEKCAGNDDCDFNCHHYSRCEKLYEKGFRKQVEGEWVDFGKTFYCSVCKKTDWYKSSYCPNCGAKMKGGAE